MDKALELLLTNFANLLKVKTIISISIVFTTCILTFKGIISVELFMTMATAIITYYFTRKEGNSDGN